MTNFTELMALQSNMTVDPSFGICTINSTELMALLLNMQMAPRFGICMANV
jgi:hypothetical protein